MWITFGNWLIITKESESEVAQSCPTLCDPMDTRLLRPWDFLGKSTGVGCISFSWESSWPRDRTQVSRIVDRRFTIWATIDGYESWTIKKAECWRIDAFELWCWRRFLRVPWNAKRSNQLILKDYSLEGLNIHWKDWCWSWSWSSNTWAT